MLHTWRWKLSTRPPYSGVTHWVWDSNTQHITGYIGDVVARQPYLCSNAVAWFAHYPEEWEPVIDSDYLMDVGL